MKKVFVALLLIATSANAEEQKSLASRAGDLIAAYAKAFGDTVSRTITEPKTGDNGARANLNIKEERERVANRGTRKSMRSV